jgi:uncharacterized protein
MKILIEDIPEEGLSVDLNESIQADNLSVISPVVSRLELHKTGSEIIINGSLDAEVGIQCSRCLKDLRLRMNVPVSVVYHPIEDMDEAGESHPARHALQNDEMDMEFYREGLIDLRDLLREQLILNTQMKPLCDDACKGLCPVCGTDLNVSSCNCDIKELDPRLAVLKKLFNDRKE